jgi:hypothetical protein
MMNFPAEMSGLVKDRAGNDVFYQDHACTQAFAEDIEDRKENDGYVYDNYCITFEEEQDTVFVSIGEANLTGFDLLRGQYINADKEVCDFKLLQILVKEKDLQENMSGTANMAKCGVLGGQSNLTTRDGPFSPSKPVYSSPTPAPVYSSPTPAPVQSSDFLHRQQQEEIQQLRAQKAENERLQKQQGTREAMLKAEVEATVSNREAQAAQRMRVEAEQYVREAQAATQAAAQDSAQKEQRIRAEAEMQIREAQAAAQAAAEAEQRIRAEAEHCIRLAQAAAQASAQDKEEVQAARDADHKLFRKEQEAAQVYVEELKRQQQSQLTPPAQNQQVVLAPAKNDQVVGPEVWRAMEAVEQARKRRAVDMFVGQEPVGVQGADGFLPVNAYVEFSGQEGDDGDLSTIDGPLEMEH